MHMESSLELHRKKPSGVMQMMLNGLVCGYNSAEEIKTVRLHTADDVICVLFFASSVYKGIFPEGIASSSVSEGLPQGVGLCVLVTGRYLLFFGVT